VPVTPARLRTLGAEYGQLLSQISRHESASVRLRTRAQVVLLTLRRAQQSVGWRPR